MNSLISDELVNHTKAFVNDVGTLTYGFRKGDLSAYQRKIVRDIIDGVDERLDGIRFKRIKPAGQADLIIGHGELPIGASGASVYSKQGWEIRMPERFFSTTIFKHELGHVLGLGHVPMGSDSLMQPTWGGITDFTKKDWKALESIWGKGEIFFSEEEPKPKGKVSSGMLVSYLRKPE
jgi:hypothetical protein